MKVLEDRVKELRSLLDRCPDAPADAQEMALLVLEQVEPVIAERDTSMAGDLLAFVEDAIEQLDACPDAPSTPAP